MKKIQEIIKPLILVIFGALLLLFYMNFINADYAENIPGYLALGIIGVTFAAYYIAVGVLNVLIGSKFNQKLRLVFDLLNISLFAAVMFTQFLVRFIYTYQQKGPTGWVIGILSMAAAIALIVIYILAKLMNKPLLNRLSFLFAAIFTLALLLDVLFDNQGYVATIGEISLVILAIYGLYADVLFASLPKAEAIESKDNKEEKPQENE